MNQNSFVKFNKKTAAIVLTLCMVLISVLAVLPVHAVTPASGQAAFEITSFNYEAVVSESHQYNVVEKISVNLTDDLTELEFALPNGNYNLGDLELDDEPYRKTDNTVKIEDPTKLKKGRHIYTIEYIISEYEDKDTNKDILYFDILPPSWMQAITNLNISVQFPEDFPLENVEYYAGQYGVQNVETKIDYNVNSTDHTVSISGNRIPENFGITLKAILDDGYWEGALNGILPRLLMIVLMLVATAGIAVMWFIGGRDPRFKRIIQAHPIDNVSPAEVGYILNGKIRTRDIISLIVYYGIRGYLKIIEYEPKRYHLIKIKDPNPSDEEKYIRNAFDILFEDETFDFWSKEDDSDVARQNQKVEDIYLDENSESEEDIDSIINRKRKKEKGIFKLEMDDIALRAMRIKESIMKDVEAGFSSKEMVPFTSQSKIFRIIGIVIISLSIGVCSVLGYFSVFQSANYIEAGFLTVITAVLLQIISNTFDEQYYSEENTYILKLMGLCGAYVLVAVYFAIKTMLLTGQIVSAVVPAILMIVAAFLIVIMRARAKGNAELANKFMQLRHFIYHPDLKLLLETIMTDKTYYYEIVPYALTFKGLDVWAEKFAYIEMKDAKLKVPEPEWYDEDIEGHAITNLNKVEKTVVDYARDFKAFARTIENAYRSIDRQGRIRWEINKK